MNDQLFNMAADVAISPNDGDAKTAKVTITARSGDPVDTPWFGPTVHDFSTMTVAKPRIPIDLNHDPDNSIGYANKFDTSTGDLVLSGAIALVDGIEGDPDTDAIGTVQKMEAGVPFEASIQMDNDFDIQFVPEGATVTVNNRDIPGPVSVITNWTLVAVAICKWGMDSDTSAQLAMSNKNKKAQGFSVHFKKVKEMTMSKATNNVPAEQAKTVEPTVEAKAVEPVAEVKEQPAMSDVAASHETKVEVATATVETQVEETKAAEDVVPSPAMSDNTDPRSEFKMFVSAFGAEKAALYFSEGKSYADAMADHVKYQQERIADLEKKISTTRGADRPLRMSVSDEAKSNAVKSEGKKMASNTVLAGNVIKRR